MSSPQTLADLLYGVRRRRIFVSYHHGGDKGYYELLVDLMTDIFEIAHDNSVQRAIDSDDNEYVWRAIRENHLTGSSWSR